MLGTLISISSYSWFSIWIGLEINILSFIPLVIKKDNIFLSESTIKYFFVQSIGSIIVLVSVLFILNYSEFIVPQINSLIIIINLALLIKLGSAPLHFWFPEIVEGLRWINCLILLTWQKVAPFILIMNNKINFNLLVIAIVCCLIVRSVISFNQIRIRKILAFSSINNIAWILCCLQCSYTIWVFYFIIYCFIRVSIVLILDYYSINFINQVFNLTNKNKILLILNLLSLGGLPPFIGFFPKWIVIYFLNLINLNFISFLVILFTLIILYVYIRIIFMSFTLSRIKTKNFLKFNFWLMGFMSFLFFSSLISITLMFNFL